MNNRLRFTTLLGALVVVTGLLIFATHLGLQRVARAQENAQPKSGDESTAQIRLLESSAKSLHFVLETPQVHFNSDGDVIAPGLEHATMDPGAPTLPSFSTFIALPPGATAEVSAVSRDIRRHDVGFVRPVPQAGPRQFYGEDPLTFDRLLTAPDSQGLGDLYEQDAFYPGTVYKLSDPMYARDLRLVRLDLFPLQYNPLQDALQQVARLDVTVHFSGGNDASARPLENSGRESESVAPHVLNYDEAQSWRSLPARVTAPSSMLPTNQETFKIAVNETGIYEVTYDALQAAGMDVDSVDPDMIEMMYRGQPVAYEFVGNDNDDFEAGEKIRFFGWAFDGSRLERQFLTENVYWLWADGTPLHIASDESTSGQPLAASYRASHTREPDWHFTHTWTDQWQDDANEPDAWIWERVFKNVGDGPITSTHEITLTAPAPTPADATVTVEILSRHPETYNHKVSIYVNGDASSMGQRLWSGVESVNVTTTVPITLLVDGVNHIQVVYETPTDDSFEIYYMNRITVDYNRQFVAEDEQLIFDDSDGNSRYQVAGFTNGNPGDVLVWRIDDRLNPLNVTGAGVVPGSGTYSYTFGTDAGPSQFLVTHEGNVKAPLSIERYVAPDLNPPDGAVWVAISHANFLNQANELARHRQQAAYGGLSTRVVDIRDVINQYGYGLPLPSAIQDYLRHALLTWPEAPQYLLLFGDGHINPRHIPCDDGNTQCQFWGDTQEPNYVLTDIVFHDPFVGLNASDYTYALLVGDDLLPDIAVGRLAVQSATEAQRIVDKIRQFEMVRLVPQSWQHNILFVADNADTAGDFCAANEMVAATLPGPYVTQSVCLVSQEEDDIEQAQTAIHDAVNNPPDNGVTFLNYRGHGAVRNWAGQLINLNAPEPWIPWFNNEPVIILSLDCLDGHFAQPGYEALSEEFLSLEYYGSAAHWSSTGFGYDFQHIPLHQGFYDGLFEHDLTTIGDAINYAKLYYVLESHHHSQLYSFTLQGDPAMEMIETGLNAFLPTIQR